MDQSNKVTEDWYIIFTRTKLKHWVFKYLQREFQHCYAVKSSPGDEFWIIVDSKNSYTDVTIRSKQHYPTIRDLAPNCVILSIHAIMSTTEYRYTLCVFNCVEVCKSLLGIRDFWCWTPYQLYKRLISWEVRPKHSQDA